MVDKNIRYVQINPLDIRKAFTGYIACHRLTTSEELLIRDVYDFIFRDLPCDYKPKEEE